MQKQPTILRRMISVLAVITALTLLSSCSIIDYVMSEGGGVTDEYQPSVDTFSPLLPEDFPEGLKEHVFLLNRGMGSCDTLCGKVCFLFVFVNSPDAVWSAQQLDDYNTIISDVLSKIEGDAHSNNISLEISSVVQTVEIDSNIDKNEYLQWVEKVLKALNLPTEDNTNIYLEKLYDADEAPIVFITPESGRSFAQQTYSENGNELAIIFNESQAIYHEICHIFGAVDMYFPDSVRALAKETFTESIMLNSSTEVVDGLTAFLMGWTDVLSDEAKSFLDQTVTLTSEEMDKAMDEENYTGFVTDRPSSDGIYTGQLVDGYFHGQGKFIFPGGGVYEGQWNFNKQHGYGTYTSVDGDTYIGDWANGTKEGYGVLTFADGSRYEGSWHNGSFHGNGTYYWSGGSSYTGEWVNGNRNGYGTLTYSDGSKYEGNWVDDVQSGKGVYYFSNGDRYDGEFSEGTKSGYGVYYWTDGTYHSGYWANGMRHGWGQTVYPNGSSTTGTWENDVYIG